MRDGTQARSISNPTSFALRATLLCRSTCQPSLTLRVHTFFCCQHAQVKHSSFARRHFVALAMTSLSRPFLARNRSSCCTCVTVRSFAHCTLSECPMEFSVPPTQTSSCVDHALNQTCVRTAALHEIHRFARHSIYVGEGDSRVGVGWRAAIHARPRSTALREDIFPGHTQYFAVRRTGGFDVDQAGRDAGDRRRRVRRKDGRFSTTRAVKSNVRPASNASVGHR